MGYFVNMFYLTNYPLSDSWNHKKKSVDMRQNWHFFLIYHKDSTVTYDILFEVKCSSGKNTGHNYF